METNHTQCLLVSPTGEQKVAWIPSIRATLNKVLINSKLFFVKERYTTIPSRDAIDNSSDYTRLSKKADIKRKK